MFDISYDVDDVDSPAEPEIDTPDIPDVDLDDTPAPAASVPATPAPEPAAPAVDGNVVDNDPAAVADSQQAVASPRTPRRKLTRQFKMYLAAAGLSAVAVLGFGVMGNDGTSFSAAAQAGVAGFPGANGQPGQPGQPSPAAVAALAPATLDLVAAAADGYRTATGSYTGFADERATIATDGITVAISVRDTTTGACWVTQLVEGTRYENAQDPSGAACDQVVMSQAVAQIEAHVSAAGSMHGLPAAGLPGTEVLHIEPDGSVAVIQVNTPNGCQQATIGTGAYTGGGVGTLAPGQPC